MINFYGTKKAKIEKYKFQDVYMVNKIKKMKKYQLKNKINIGSSD